ncbi:MAG: class I SAM-dependent rRNA methyltransferase [Nitrospirae bacterium]|nr:class I SAM-dependent rRNA methyltransferase [Nitrospirota bacterium]
MNIQKIHLKRTKRINAGHLWIFSNEIYENPRIYAPGSLVEIYDMKNIFLGIGYINPHSLISIRILTREKESIDKEFFRRRISEAIKLRVLLGQKDAMRLVFSEGDYIPGLIIDRYNECLVLQFLTSGIEAFRGLIIELIDEMFSPEVIVLKNESRVRTLEGLPVYKEIVKGNLHKLPVINEDGISFRIDPYEGQKTGFFLDQRENRIAVKQLIKQGRGLDLFCYTGAWSLHLASNGVEVTGVDESERAVTQAKNNAEINGFHDRVKFIKDNVFAFLEKELKSNEKKYDFIIADPPAFVKSANRIKEAVNAYRELNEICIRLLKPSGIFVTSSCSYHISREMFLDMLRSSGKSAGRNLRLLNLRSQSPDHPILLSMPETEYLKCAFLLVDN